MKIFIHQKKTGNFPSQIKLAISDLVSSWGLTKPIIKYKSERGHGLGQVSKIWKFPFDISAMTGVSISLPNRYY